MSKLTATDQLEALQLQMKRALRCALNKIIEPNLDDELRDRVRLDIDISALLAGFAKRALQAEVANWDRERIAKQIETAIAAWLEDDGLNWLGDAADLSRLHFSPRQH